MIIFSSRLYSASIKPNCYELNFGRHNLRRLKLKQSSLLRGKEAETAVPASCWLAL